MAISTNESRIIYSGNNSTTQSYYIPFRFDDTAWISVAKISASGVVSSLNQGTDYTLTGQTFSTTVAIPNDEKLQVSRNAPALQTLSSSSPSQAYNTALEKQMDQTTMALQDVDRKLTETTVEITDRALKGPVGETITPLPAAATRAGKVLAFDSTGTPLMAPLPVLDAMVVAASAAQASQAAGQAAISATASSNSASAAAGSAALAGLIIQPMPGPYSDGSVAIAAGVPVGYPFYKPDLTPGVARFRASQVTGFGDSITQNNSDYFRDAYFTESGKGYMQYRLRPQTPQSHLYSVVHINPGGTGALSVNLDSITKTLTVTLGRSSGIVTSTVNQVKTAVLASYSDYYQINQFDAGSLSAPTQGQTRFLPSVQGPNFNALGILAWLQILMRQRFNFTRRLINYYSGGGVNPEGDWTHGYAGHTALAVTDTPFNDTIADGGDLFIMCIGTNSVEPTLGNITDPTILRDHIVALFDKFAANNRQLFWLEIPPRGDATQNAVITAANALLRPIADAKRIPRCGWDPSFQTGGVANAAFSAETGNKIHPHNAAALRQAVYMLPYVEPFIQPTPPNYGNQSDGMWLTSNIAMTGDVSGQATGWNNFSLDLITPSKIAATDGGNNWQRLTISQPGGYAEASFSGPSATSGWSAGDIIEGVLEIRGNSSGWSVRGLMVIVHFSGLGGAQIATMRTYKGLERDFVLMDPFSGIARTPPCPIPVGTTGVNISLSVFGSGIIDIRNGGVRKSTQP